MTFTSKKEADAYDKMLDIADNLIPFLEGFAAEDQQGALSETQIEALSFYLATHKDALTSLLKGGNAPVTKEKRPAAEKTEAEVAQEIENQPE